MEIKQQLTVKDLKNQGSYLKTCAGPKTNLQDKNNVMEGQWSYTDLGKGLYIHYVDMYEVDSISVSSELSSGISFNILYEGKIDFSIGGLKHSLHSKAKALTCGCFAINSPEMRTRHTNKGVHVKKVNVFVEKKWLLERFQNNPKLMQKINHAFAQHAKLFVWQPKDDVHHIIERIIFNNTDETIWQDLKTEAQILNLLAVLIEEFMQQIEGLLERTKSEEKNTNAGQASLFFERCHIYLENNLEHKISLNDFADFMGISKSTLQRRFKTTFNMNVAEYARWLKLEKSKQYLIEGQLSIGEIAYEAGYDYPANFITAFKRQFSISPLSFQKLHKK